MMTHWTPFVICLLVVHFHLSLGNPFQKRPEARLPCTVYRLFERFGSSREIPQCDLLHTACGTHSDCPPAFKCECNHQCGMVCKCPPARRDEQQYRVGGISMTRCSGRHKCSNTSDCSGLSSKWVQYECVCSKRCGQVCQAIPTVAFTAPAPGRCPMPSFIYDVFPLCRVGAECVNDAHCIDNENMKCCQSTCGKKCMLAVHDVEPSSISTSPPSSTPTTSTTTSSSASIAMISSEVQNEGFEFGVENATDMTTDVTTNFEMTLDTLVDEVNNEEHADHKNADHDDQSNINSNQRSSRETSRCKTGLRQRNRPGGGRRRCNSNHPCYSNGHYPLCGNNGVSYANECYLLREQDRLGVDIAIRHQGYCEGEEEGGGSASENELGKRKMDSGAGGCGMYTPCDMTGKSRAWSMGDDDNLIESIPVRGNI